jgi:adenylosuccinate synthase
MNALEEMVKDHQIISVICNQWGDTGKGKFSDYFAANWADVIARGTGGNNAGHTTIVNGKKRVFHLLPAGIIYDKPNILGNGMVLDLSVLCSEMDELDKENIQYNKLMISEDAHVILPHQIGRDKQKNTDMQKGEIGSTGRGIGPCYGDKILRHGVMVRDLDNKDLIAKKLKKAKHFYPNQDLNIDNVMDYVKPFADRLKPFVRDTISQMHDFVKEGKRISLEGAQGLGLDVEFGTYPYVTSSSPSANGTASGVGLPARIVETFGIVKFPYMTRVGAGPFPTEFGGIESEKYCADVEKYNHKFELTHYGIEFKVDGNKIKYDHAHPNIVKLMNSNDSMEKGIGVRLAGEEYGATTGRPRRNGWTDLVALKYAVGINGPNLILTKVDVLQGMDSFKLGTSYDGAQNFTRDSDKLYDVKAGYEEFKGFNEDLSKVSDYNNLPGGLKQAIDFTENYTGGKVRIVSVGADQNATIIKG